jgi:hypothetical protein
MGWFNFNKAEDNLPKLENPLEKAWNKLSEDEQKLSKSIIKVIEIATKMGLKDENFLKDTYYCGEVKVERHYCSCGSLYKYGKRYDKNLNTCSYSVNDYLTRYFSQKELERLNKKSEEFVQYMEKVNLYTVKFND